MSAAIKCGRSADGSARSDAAKSEEMAKPAGDRAPSLAELQELFQQAVMDGDDAILDRICDNSRTTRDVLLGVYRHAYAARLVEVLTIEYPHLQAYLGAPKFDQMARAYLKKHPSQTQNARWFGRHLPAFLAEDGAFRDRQELADLARLEFALSVAFDAEDAAVLGLENLAAFKPDDWARLVFERHPSAQLVRVTTDAMALWMAMKEGAPVPQSLDVGEHGQQILVWRQETMPKLRIAEPEEAMVWQEAQLGLPFGALCEMVATFAEPETAAVRAAQYLQGWVTCGMLSGARLSDD